MHWLRIRPRLLAVLSVLAVSATVSCSSVFGFGDNTQDFIPADAAVVDGVDCSLWEVRTPLEQQLDWYPPSTESSAAPIGYPPDDFDPVEVTRCERGQDEAGTLTIDTVRLGGNIEAVVDAFRTPSKQFKNGDTMVSCAIIGYEPAGLWLVDGAGRAIRPQWPRRPCGFLPVPSKPIADLDEIGRSSEPVVGVAADDPGICPASYGSPFSVTTQSDVNEAIEREDQRSGYGPTDGGLGTPIDDVGRLQVCSSATSPEGFVEQSRVRLTLTDSRRLTSAAAQSSIAPACTEVATRIAVTDLVRPDGSGGTRLSAELDGCRRIEFGGYRSIALEVADLLSSEHF